MAKKLLFGFASVALAVASAATGYNVTLYQPVVVNGAKLDAGAYRIEVEGGMATIKKGKNVTEAPVKVETDGAKFNRNTVRIEGDRLSEIRIGGTHTKLVFDKADDSNATK